MKDNIRLTQFSHGAGCGCKIAPAVLNTILKSDQQLKINPKLLVGNETKDDAAVYEINQESCIISTTDFFMPIVDDPFTFGSIAAVNAISDVYAMGGNPLMAIAILGWPIQKIPIEAAASVLDGGRDACFRAGIPLAGGHSIDCPEPIFGLAVTGQVDKTNLKKNSGAKPESLLYLTKPLGVGIITTAQKKGIVDPNHLNQAIESMLQLNDAGKEFGKLNYVNALTDVTGFGLLGHLLELCEAGNVSAKIDYESVPKFNFLNQYIHQQATPGGTDRNLKSYGMKVHGLNEHNQNILADPQTSGGLLVSVDPSSQQPFEAACKKLGLNISPIGQLTERTTKLITIL